MMASITWLNGISGDWSDASDWSSGTIPGSADDVTINAPGGYTVTIDVLAEVNSFTLDDAGATVDDTSDLVTHGVVALEAGSFILAAGAQIQDGTLSALGGQFVWDGGLLGGITYDGVMDLGTNGASVTLAADDEGTGAGSNLFTGAGGSGAGSISLTGFDSSIELDGSQTLDNATLTMGGASAGTPFIQLLTTQPTAATLTLGRHFVLDQDGAGQLDCNDYGLNAQVQPETIINDGTMQANVAAADLTIWSGGAATDVFVNASTGTITVSSGGTIAAAGTGAAADYAIADLSIGASAGDVLIDEGTISLGADSLLGITGAAMPTQSGTLMSTLDNQGLITGSGGSFSLDDVSLDNAGRSAALPRSATPAPSC